MRMFLMALALGSLCLVCGISSTAAMQHGQIPNSMLSDMGLSGMQPMSDAQGMLIRAKGGGGGGGGGGGSTINTTGDITVTIKQVSVINFENNTGDIYKSGGGNSCQECGGSGVSTGGGSLTINTPINVATVHASTASTTSSSHHHH